MPAPKKPTKRSIAAKAKFEKDKVGRLHSIAERRAKSAGMSKKDYIAAIVKGEFRPITAEDIANEPDVPIEEVAADDVPVEEAVADDATADESESEESPADSVAKSE